jgi:L-amino acid N-acyltransferase YncA
MTITIRNAGPDDLPFIQQIYAESVLNGVATYELTPPDIEEMRERFRTITGNGYPYLAGESGGKIAGYAYASAFRTRAAYRFLVEDSIYIDPQFRGMGLGRMLLDRLVVECTALGFRQMVAVIGGAHPASIAVHRAAGFESTGRMPGSGWKFGRWLDTELMQLALGEGTSKAPAAGEYPDKLYGG